MTEDQSEAAGIHYGDRIAGDSIRQDGNHNIGKIDNRRDDVDDLRSLRQFVTEVQKALPRLGLDPENRELAQQQIDQIQAAGKSDRPNPRLLGNLASSLRTIVQSAAHHVADLVVESIELIEWIACAVRPWTPGRTA